MPNAIQLKPDDTLTIDIDVDTLLTATAEASASIDNATLNRPGAIINLIMKSGGTSTPTAGSLYEVFLLRLNEGANYGTDGWDGTKGAITIENAELLATIVLTATANKLFYVDIDTEPLGKLGTKWGIAVRNSSGQTTGTTAGDFTKEYQTYLFEIQ